MKINKTIVAVMAVLVLALGFEAAAADEKNMSIGIVDFDQAVLATEEGKAAIEEFERKAREIEVELKPMVEEMQGLMAEYQQQEAVRSDEWKQDKQLEAASLRNRIEFKQKEAQSQLEVHRERLVAPLRTKLIEVVNTLGREEGYSLIIARGAPGIMYTRESLDITDLVIEKFNAKKKTKKK